MGFGFEVTASGIQEQYSGSKAEVGPAVGHGGSLRQRTRNTRHDARALFAGSEPRRTGPTSGGGPRGIARGERERERERERAAGVSSLRGRSDDITVVGFGLRGNGTGRGRLDQRRSPTGISQEDSLHCGARRSDSGDRPGGSLRGILAPRQRSPRRKGFLPLRKSRGCSGGFLVAGITCCEHLKGWTLADLKAAAGVTSLRGRSDDVTVVGFGLRGNGTGRGRLDQRRSPTGIPEES